MNPEVLPGQPPTDASLEWAPPEDMPDLDSLVIEDGQLRDSVYFEKLCRLLTEALYSSWPGPGEGHTFEVFANVGLFDADKTPPLAPAARAVRR
jgi:hypothetical protein